MSKHLNLVPSWLRIIVGLLALLNIAFGVMGYVDISILFKSTGALDLNSAVLKHASYEFAARNLAIGLGLGIVALKGVPESLTIVLIIRALIEFQTILTNLLSGLFSSALVMPLIFLIVEIFLIMTLIGVIKKRDVSN